MGHRLGAKRRDTFRYHEHLQRRLRPIAGSTRRAGAIFGARRRCQLVVWLGHTPRRRLAWHRNSPRHGPDPKPDSLLGRSASLFDGPRIGTPLYRFPVFGLLALAIAAVATGIAREALDAFIGQASQSVPQAGSKPLAAKATVQAAVAQAEASLQAARAYLLASIDAAWQTATEAADQGTGPLSGALPLAQRRDVRLAASHAVHTSAAVVTRLYTLAGGGAVFASSPLQRCLRNVQVATPHMMVNDASFELTGRLLLGVPTPTHML